MRKYIFFFFKKSHVLDCQRTVGKLYRSRKTFYEHLDIFLWLAIWQKIAILFLCPLLLLKTTMSLHWIQFIEVNNKRMQTETKGAIRVFCGADQKKRINIVAFYLWSGVCSQRCFYKWTKRKNVKLHRLTGNSFSG